MVNADNDDVSGTNVQVGLVATALNTGAPVADPVSQVRLKKAVLTVGGETLYSDEFLLNWTPPGPATSEISYTDPVDDAPDPIGTSRSNYSALQGPNPEPFEGIKDPRDIIFASTHFAFNSQVTVTLTLTFALKRASGSVTEVQLDPAIIKPKAWNRVTLWRTHRTGAGLPLLPNYPLWDGWMEDAVNVANTWHTNAKYSVSIVDPGTRAAILLDMASSTSVFAITHGNPSSIDDSTNGTITWSDMETALGDRYHPAATLRPVSHVYLYACNTVPGMEPTKFWLWREPLNNGSPAVNSSGNGFNNSYTFTALEQQHMHVFFQQFDLGKTAKRAVTAANDAFPIPASYGSSGTFAKLTIIGDEYQTFNHVYLPPAVRDALPEPKVYTNWWWAPPHVP
jgi:hypothetical protein